MARQQLIQELQMREKELLDELESIRKILRSNTIEGSTGKSNQDGQLEKVTASGSAKGKKSWEEYIVDVLKEVGGKVKSKDIADAVIKANPNIPESRIMHAVRHHLSLLSKNGKINANKSKIKSEGYEYFIK